MSLLLSACKHSAVNKLSIEQIKNANITVAEFNTPRQNIKLINGSYIRPDHELSLHMTDKITFGDLDNDSNDDAIAILYLGHGGSVSDTLISALINEAGKPNHISTIGIEDDAEIHDVKIVNGIVVVFMSKHGPDDPHCCPSIDSTHYYQLNQNKLNELSPMDPVAKQAAISAQKISNEKEIQIFKKSTKSALNMNDKDIDLIISNVKTSSQNRNIKFGELLGNTLNDKARLYENSMYKRVKSSKLSHDQLVSAVIAIKVLHGAATEILTIENPRNPFLLSPEELRGWNLWAVSFDTSSINPQANQFKEWLPGFINKRDNLREVYGKHKNLNSVLLADASERIQFNISLLSLVENAMQEKRTYNAISTWKQAYLELRSLSY